jgi:hypothetical protein
LRGGGNGKGRKGKERFNTEAAEGEATEVAEKRDPRPTRKNGGWGTHRGEEKPKKHSQESSREKRGMEKSWLCHRLGEELNMPKRLEAVASLGKI